MPFTEKRLAGPTQLTTSSASLYTVPSSKTAIVKQIVATNTSASAATFSLYIGTATAANSVFNATSVAANDSLVINLSQVLATGEVLNALASANTSINLTISGVENDGPLTPNATYIADNAVTTAKLADSSVTSAKIADGAIVTADISANAVTQTKLDTTIPLSGFRNRIINGGFDIWQRGTSFALTTASPYYTVDRWQTTRAGAAAGGTQTRQSASFDGFQYCTRIQRDSGNTSTASFFLGQSFETIDVYRLMGKPLVLSFYARAGANYSATSNALVADIMGGTGTDGNILNTGFTGQTAIATSTATLTTSWQRFQVVYSANLASTTTQLGVRFTFNPVGTAGVADYFEITGVQLEIGSQVTPFEQRPYGVELALCQRYYQTWRYHEYNEVVGTLGYSPGNYYYGASSMPITMRTTPQVTLTSASCRKGSDASLVSGTLVYFNATADGVYWCFAAATGGYNAASFFINMSNASAEL